MPNNSPIYRRVSKEEQALNANGLNAQEDVCRSYATRNGLNVIGMFTDGGVSGSMGLEHRPALLDAIAALGKGDVLLVAKRDRIGRLDPMAMAMIEAAVRRKGGRIVSAAGEGTADDDPSSILMRRMVDAFAEYERLIIGARTKAALGAKRKRGEKLGGLCEYGTMRGPDRPGANGKPIKTVVPCPSEVEVIELVHTLRAQGVTLEGIATDLDVRGIKRRGGGRFHYQFVAMILKKTAA
jgi:site-specific DNA recombinase